MLGSSRAVASAVGSRVRARRIAEPQPPGSAKTSKIDEHALGTAMHEGNEDITVLLRRWSSGDRQALDDLIPIVYEELHKLARAYMLREATGRTLESTALVNEAFLRLVKQRDAQWQNRTHFYGVAAQIMRRILVDAARERHALKRGGAGRRLSLDEALTIPSPYDDELLALDQALQELANFAPEKARIVELRYFGGLSVADAAEALSISPTTVKRDWAIARAWLYNRLYGEAGE